MSLKFNDKNEVLEWLRSMPSQGIAHTIIARIWSMSDLKYEPFGTLRAGFQWFLLCPDENLLFYAIIVHNDLPMRFKKK